MPTRREFLGQSAAATCLAGAQFLRTAAPLAAMPPTDGAQATARRVHTVLGPIDPSSLGVTLPHEHLFASSAGFWQAYPDYFGGRTRFLATVTDRLKALRDDGVSTIVDVTPIDVGRDIRFIEEASRRSGMQIIACTGHWLDPSASMKARTVEELAEFFIREIERGIDGTDIRPGVIKVATDREGVTPFLDNALKAAARASRASGVPVTTHTYAPARVGDRQAEIFEAESLDPRRVCIGHCDDSDDMAVLTGLARRGYTLGMDHLTHGLRQPATGLTWQRRADNVKRLVDAGFVDRLFLSNDWFFGIALGPKGTMEALERTNPDGMAFVSRKVLPYLRGLGVTDRQIQIVTVDNPRRLFGGA